MFKKYVAASVLVSLTLWLSGCGDAKKEADESSTLIMMTSPDNKPFEFYRTEEGAQEIVGYDIDTAYALGEILGVKVEVKGADFNGLIPALQAGRADFVMSAMTPNPERLKNISFSEPYFVTPVAVVARADLSIHRDKDFDGLRVGAQLGTTHEQLAKDIAAKGVNVTVVSLNQLGELVEEVRSGRLDCVVMGSLPAKAYVEKQENLTYGLLEEYQISYAVAFPKDSPWVSKFNKAIKELEEKGTLTKIAKKWLIN